VSGPAYVHRHTVTFDETNLVGNVYFAHYAHWQGHCREYFLKDHVPGILADLSAGLALVTVSCDLEFYAESQAFDVVDIAMRLAGTAGNRITMAFDYLRIADPGSSDPTEPELIARGNQTVAVMFREASGLRPARVPDELVRALHRYDGRRQVVR
jgi:enediyne biosynthesis thioesterase